ncbi:D-ribose ABC transporter substrate-binding protein [Sphingobacterium phlebotomi]|uniref:D-ribose ABC transporter substrate-binding protein n=1 Tax=Sphingobacterium phlebotomi TaxID=2605433 RepID=A0A5D4HA13_9SPHI|nr:D-ribose ABC transporter substrate-binding protein [Sphingobacterium phlebotomi]TYR38011.1 D-ribose ABC transporter substrate-binding protein [Sphingobacterium phlebotomi]
MHIIYRCLWVGVLLSLWIACGGEKSNEDKPKQLAIIVSTLNNPWFVFLAETAKEEAQNRGYVARIFDSQNNTSLESDHFENAVALGYDAILLNATDSDGSIANARKAMEAGIPVFCMDRELNNPDAATSQIVSDSYSGCVELGGLFVRSLGQKGKYVELLGLVGDNNTWNRSKGFHAVVDHFPEIQMVAQQSADFDRNKAMEVLESILQAHPDVDAVFCGNDAMAMGAYQALVAAGKAKDIQVFGFDGSEDAVRSIQSGGLSATVMQFPQKIAETAVVFAGEYFEGNTEFSPKTLVDVEMVTPANVSIYSSYGKE